MSLPPTPQVYSDVAAEYRAATEDAALHDSSYTGRLRAKGADALDLLNRLSTNGILNLPPGRGAPTILTTDRGRILDLLGVVNTGAYILLLTSPDTPQQVMEWLDKYTIMEDLTVADLTPDTALLTVCGPRSADALAQVIKADPDRASGSFRSLIAGEPLIDREPADGEITAGSLAQLSPYSSLPAAIAGVDTLAIYRPCGSQPAFDLLVARAEAAKVWDALTAAGLATVGREAYDAALVQWAAPRYGRELGDTYNPLEAGLIGAVDFAKGCYIGQEVIARLDTYQKVQKYLTRLRFAPGAVATEGAGLEMDGRKVGQITSLAVIPTTGELLGLGYVRVNTAAAGAQLTLSAPAQGAAEVVDLPQLFGAGQ